MQGGVPAGDMGLVHLERSGRGDAPAILREMTHAMTRPRAAW